MRRTGKRAVRVGAFLAWLAPMVALADPELVQQVDRDEIGLQDTVNLTVVASDLPAGAELQFPSSPDFEVLSRFQSSQRVFRFGGGQSGIQEVEKYTQVLRPKRVGKLTLPPARAKTSHGEMRTRPVVVTVHPGSLGKVGEPRRARPRPDPFGGLGGFPPMPGFDDDSFDDFFKDLADEQIPRSESDLFLRAHLDKSEAYVGEQVTYSLYVFSRVDLSSVDAVTAPKMDGFWSEEVESPTQLVPEQKTLDGVPYRVYLLRRRALFPEKAGTQEIAPAGAEITTGFLFAGRRVHRDSNKLTLEVKAPPPGAPPDFRPEQVGEWKLSVDAQPPEVELGQPVTVRVSLEGRGNVKRLVLPKLPGIPGLKPYDPTTTDTVSPHQGKLGGRRAQEYLVMPQRTGSFTLPPVRFAYFNPKVGRYQVTESTPLTFTVKPGPSAPPEAGVSGTTGGTPVAKNVLAGGALRPLRAEAEFQSPARPVWRQPLFLGLTLAPFFAYVLSSLGERARTRKARVDPASVQKRRARAARERLAKARALLEGPADAFYAEVERAVLSSIEFKVGSPVGGLSRADLLARLVALGYPERQRAQVLRVLEACEAARYAPGLAGGSRTEVLHDAAGIISGGEG